MQERLETLRSSGAHRSAGVLVPEWLRHVTSRQLRMTPAMEPALSGSEGCPLGILTGGHSPFYFASKKIIHLLCLGRKTSTLEIYEAHTCLSQARQPKTLANSVSSCKLRQPQSGSGQERGPWGVVPVLQPPALRSCWAEASGESGGGGPASAGGSLRLADRLGASPHSQEGD